MYTNHNSSKIKINDNETNGDKPNMLQLVKKIVIISDSYVRNWLLDQVSKESSQRIRMKNDPFMQNSASITKLNLYIALLKIGEILIKRAIILGCFSSTPIAATI